MMLRRKLSLRRVFAWVGASLGALVLAVALLLLVLGGVIINRYGKGKAEGAFAEVFPGYVLRLGELDYALGANRLVAQSATLSGTNATLKSGRILLTGVSWARLLRGRSALVDVLAKASLDVTNLDLEFPKAHYELRCERLRASMPGSELIAEGAELRPLVGDEELFASEAFRVTRFHVVVPECRVLGLALAELLQGKSYRAKSINFFHPSFEALVNRDKPRQPFLRSPLMPQEALASLRQPLQVGILNVTNGQLRYCERLAIGADPAVLTIGALNLSVEGLANQGDATAAVQLRGQGDLMNAGTMKVSMSIPMSSTNFSLDYSGSLNAMDLTRLDAFLDIAEHTRIKSGSAQEAAFDIHVTSGQATGRVSAIYKDLEIALLDKQTGNEKGAANRLASFLANVVKIRSANTAAASGSSKVGTVNYARKPEDEFQQFLWFALRTGVLDIISH